MKKALDARLLGGFSLLYNGQAVNGLQAERLVLLLSYLLLNTNTPVPRRQAAFLFWPDSTEEQARANLRNSLHLLRRDFPEIDSFLELDSQSIRWKADVQIELDVRQFNDALTQAKASETDQARTRYLQEAVNTYRGELLPRLYENWVLVLREELHQSYLGALSQLAKLLEDARQYEEAIDVVNRLVHGDSLSESAYQHSMRLHALKGDRAGAMQVYHTCATILKRELDLEPSAEINSLYEQLIQSKEVGREQQASEGRRLVGRKQEWGQLRSAWGSASKGKPTFVLLLGEAGIGKTRLAEELMGWTRRQGIRTAVAQCYPAEGNLPFAPVITWLRAEEMREDWANLDLLWKKELGRLMPEHELEKPETISGTKWQRQRLFEALTKGLLGSGVPRLLVLDDAQWSDQETLELIHYLLRYDANAPLMILATVRAEALDEKKPLDQLRTDLQSKGSSIEMELAPLEKADVASLARDLTGNELDDAKIDNLFANTEGNPFFIVEILRSRGFLQGAGLPQRLRSVLTQRLNQLSPSARELMGLAAAIGREFSYRLLADVSTLNETALVQSLDELWARRVIQMHGSDSYNFTHGKLQDAAYETLTAPRRLLVHRKIAEALLNEAERGFEVESGIVARHLERGGQYQAAVEHYLKAAEEARRVFANREAISHLEKSLSLLSEKVGLKDGSIKHLACEAYDRLGQVYEISDNFKQARDAYSQAFSLAEPSGRLVRARLLGKIAKETGELMEHEEAIRLFIQAEEMLGSPPQDDQEWGQTWLNMQFDRVWMQYEHGIMEGMQSILEAIRPVVERLGEPDQLSRYYFLLPAVYFQHEGYEINEDILRWYTLALQTSQKTENLEVRTRANFGYGFCNYMLGNFDIAIQHMTEGLKLADQIGHVEQQSYNLTYLAAAHRRAGNLEACKSYAERALTFCEREGWQVFAATAQANLGWIAWKKGDLKKAKELSRKAVDIWRYYPFQWYGLWTLIDISLASSKVDEAMEYARRLKAPGQQVFPKEVDDLLNGAIEAAEERDKSKSQSLLMKAVDWAKKNHYL